MPWCRQTDGERIGLRLLNFMGRNTRGVCVVGVKPTSAGANSGVEEGDMIVEINGHSVLNLTHEQVCFCLRFCFSGAISL